MYFDLFTCFLDNGFQSVGWVAFWDVIQFGDQGRYLLCSLVQLHYKERWRERGVCINSSTGELRGIEQALAVKTSKGIVVVTGCSHPGVGEILDAASCYGKVYGIIGGLHGFRDFGRLNGLSLICPCHCTQYKSELRSLFPSQYISCGAGLELEL